MNYDDSFIKLVRKNKDTYEIYLNLNLLNRLDQNIREFYDRVKYIVERDLVGK